MNFMSEASYWNVSNERKQEKGNLFASLPSQMYLNIMLVCHWIVLADMLTQLKFDFTSAIFLVILPQL